MQHGGTLCRQAGGVKRRCDSRRDWLIRRWRQTRTVGAELVAFGPLDTLGDEDDEAPATEGAHERLTHWEQGRQKLGATEYEAARFFLRPCVADIETAVPSRRRLASEVTPGESLRR